MIRFSVTNCCTLFRTNHLWQYSQLQYYHTIATFIRLQSININSRFRIFNTSPCICFAKTDCYILFCAYHLRQNSKIERYNTITTFICLQSINISSRFRIFNATPFIRFFITNCCTFFITNHLWQNCKIKRNHTITTFICLQSISINANFRIFNTSPFIRFSITNCCILFIINHLWQYSQIKRYNTIITFICLQSIYIYSRRRILNSTPSICFSIANCNIFFRCNNNR